MLESILETRYMDLGSTTLQTATVMRELGTRLVGKAARKTIENAINLKRVDDQQSSNRCEQGCHCCYTRGAYNYKGCNPNIPSSNILLDVCRKHAYTMQHCRTDVSNALSTPAWVRIPYPLQWGIPIFHFRTSIIMVIVSLVASVDSAESSLILPNYLVPYAVASSGPFHSGIKQVLVCIISVVGDTKLITKVLIPELQPNLKELVLDEASLINYHTLYMMFTSITKEKSV